MKFLLKLAALAFCYAPALYAQPIVYALQNNYSFTYPGLPNYGIARGSLFDIWGAGMASAPTLLQTPPLRTTLEEVAINVTVDGVTVHPALYYLSPNQIAAVMPSDTPLGRGEITVTYNGRTSSPFPLEILQTAFGILTLNNAGFGAAAAFDRNNAMLGFANVTHPGDEVLFWGTGLGPAPGGDADWQTPQNLSDISIEVKIGGIPAQVVYRGRSILPGVDQVKVVIPAGVEGCRVSVVVRSGDIVSNFATIPVAAAGTTCSDQTTGFSSEFMAAIGQRNTIRVGSVILGRNVAIDSTGNSTASYTASAAFQRYSPLQFHAAPAAVASIGSCAVYTAFGPNMIAPPGFSQVYLNAGAAVNVTGPAGAVSLGDHGGIYDSVTFPVIIPESGGSFTFNNGPGGTQVGPLTGSLTIPPPLVWSNRSSINPVSRIEGVTVTWTGGAPDTYVQISGGSSLPNGVRAFFGCAAPISAGRFTVPAEVLLSLPAAEQGFLAVSNFTNPKPFTAPELDAGFASGYTSFMSVVAYR